MSNKERSCWLTTTWTSSGPRPTCWRPTATGSSPPTTGHRGLELARQEHPDLMVLDVMMATKTEGLRGRPADSRLPGAAEHAGAAGHRHPQRDEAGLPPRAGRDLAAGQPHHGEADRSGRLRRRGRRAAPPARRDGLEARRAAAWSRASWRTRTAELWTVSPRRHACSRPSQMMEKYRVGSPAGGRGRQARWASAPSATAPAASILQDRAAKDTPVRDVMTSPVICVSPDDTHRGVHVADDPQARSGTCR